MSILIPLAVLIVGFVMYLLTTKPVLVELARAMIWCGLLVTLLLLGGKSIEILK